MQKKIYFHRPAIGQEEIDEVVDTLQSGWLTTGPKTRKFEEDFKNYIRCSNAVALNSCTAGLHLALAACDIGSGDEVITTPITFPSTASVIIHSGATPVFADILSTNLTIDPDKIEEKITDKTKAIIPVHLAGMPCHMDKIMALAKKHNLRVIEDGAHALESFYHGKKIGTIGDFTSFSFYATKNITTGEGGMLTIKDEKLAEKVRIMGLHGISKDAWKRYGKNGYQHWEMIYAGFKYNMFDIQAALGIHQLAKVQTFAKQRKKIVKLYDQAFQNFPNISLPDKTGDILHANHLYIIVLKTEELGVARDDVINEIQSHGVNLGVHFRALHLMPFFTEHFNFSAGMFPVAEYISDRVLSLPLYPGMSEEDTLHIISIFKKVIQRYV